MMMVRNRQILSITRLPPDIMLSFRSAKQPNVELTGAALLPRPVERYVGLLFSTTLGHWATSL